jgi:CRISPR/Cas system-associated exonuclease Cas4 (RecB family)
MKTSFDRTLPDVVKKFTTAHTCCKNWTKWELERVQLGGSKPEVEMKLNHDGYYGIVDIVDLVLQKPGDFKTQKVPSVNKHQAAVYGRLLNKHFNWDIEKFPFIFLQQPDKVMEVDLKSTEMDTIREGQDQVRDAIFEAYNTHLAEKKPSKPDGCKNCDVKYYCKVLQL